MKKAEQEAHFHQYQACLRAARGARDEGLLQDALAALRRSLEHIEGFVRFKKSSNKTHKPRLDAISLTLELAPLALDRAALDDVRVFLKRRRRILGNPDGLEAQCDRAEARLQDAYRLWDLLERQGPADAEKAKQCLGSRRATWQRLLDDWSRFNLVRRSSSKPECYELVTLLSRRSAGRCVSCGAIAQGPKRAFLDQAQCPRCGQIAWFVLVH